MEFFNFLAGSFDGSLIWFDRGDGAVLVIEASDVENMIATEAVFFDLPAGSLVELKTDKVGKLVFGQIGFDNVAKIGEQLLIVGAENFRVGQFVDDGFHDNGLIFDAVQVAVSIVFTLAGKGEGASAVDVILTSAEVTLRRDGRTEISVGVNSDAA